VFVCLTPLWQHGPTETQICWHLALAETLKSSVSLGPGLVDATAQCRTCQSQLNIPCIHSDMQRNIFTGLLHPQMQDYCICHATNQTLFSSRCCIHTACFHSSRIYDATLLNHIRAIKHTLSILLLLHLYSCHKRHFMHMFLATHVLLGEFSRHFQYDYSMIYLR